MSYRTEAYEIAIKLSKIQNKTISAAQVLNNCKSFEELHMWYIMLCKRK